MNEVKRTERGWPGHLIVASQCGFRRNTLLEYGDRKWIISTVGAYRNIEGKMDSVGYERWYETMAFVGVEENGYIDADVMQNVWFNSEWGLFADSWEDLKKQYPYPDNSANDMHEKVVEELMERIKDDREVTNPFWDER